jgi:hypothetical protein
LESEGKGKGEKENCWWWLEKAIFKDEW